MYNERENIANFYDPIEMPGGYTFDHVGTLRMINLYYNSKFSSGQFDNRGFRKFFYNIVKPACDIATKFVDLDTKDIILSPTREAHETKVFLMQHQLRQWMKDNNFGVTLNKISEQYPKGHVVLKKHKKRFSLVNIENLRMDTTAPTLHDSDFVYEVHRMSKGEIESMPWNKEAVAELFERGDEKTYLIYECYHKDGDTWHREIKGDLYTQTDSRGNVFRNTESTINSRNEYLPSIVLDERSVGDLPYRELKWEDVPGRWLGRGFIEYLEDNQVAINEAENLERKGLAHKSLQVWQTRDDSLGGSNIFSSAENGDILKIDSELQPLTKDNSDLSAFNNTRNNWTLNTERKTFTTDITTGANLPSRTPLGVANLQASLATSFFELKAEWYGLFIKELVVNDIIPDFLREYSSEHTIIFSGSNEDIDRIDNVIVEALVSKAVVDHAERTGFYPSQRSREEARVRVRRELRRSGNRYLQAPENYYKDAKYIVDVIVTGESVDVSARSQLLQLVLQMTNNQPQALENPVTRGVISKMLGYAGMTLADIGADQITQQQTQAPMQPGGSLAAPQGVQGMAPTNITV